MYTTFAHIWMWNKKVTLFELFIRYYIFNVKRNSCSKHEQIYPKKYDLNYEILYTVLFRGRGEFSSLQLLPHRRKTGSQSVNYRYFYGKCSDDLHSSVPPVETFTARDATANLLIRRVSNVRKMFHSAFSHKLPRCGTDSRVDTSPNATLLTTSS